ncbi:MAG: ATP-binding cassette domain-containing protein [Candidatus Thermoplasmatota archaeon]|nr:ATP-binding cassette domain-containing protein [Candidatus Thermoplasmatota archaeon]MCL5789997.1 ATP-binding cassette domain-containing protein [Candidatus Thermoplasmatota archaeon]
MNEPILEVENLTVQFKRKTKLFKAGREQERWKKVLDSISFNIKQGETFGIVGETGSGKTTLARTLVGIYRPRECRIRLNGKHLDLNKKEDVLLLRKNIGIVFQDPVGSLNPRVTVSEIISEGIPDQKKLSERQMEAKIMEASELVELPGSKLESFPTELSGGEKQRVSLARTLVGGKKILVLDEPTSSLDVSIQAQILNLLLRLKNELSISYIFITHDLNVIKHMCERVAVLYYGQILEQGNTYEIFEHPRHPYTADLIGANLSFTSNDGFSAARESGEPSREGCIYQNSCSKKFLQCEKPPPTFDLGKTLVKCWLYDYAGGDHGESVDGRNGGSNGASD